METRLKIEIEALKENFQIRKLPMEGNLEEKKIINLSSNDYLNLSSDNDILEEFYSQSFSKKLSSTGSRLLSGNFRDYRLFEDELAEKFNRQALVYNSGYHANLGILPAIANKKCLILADKLVHHSILDGLKMSEAKFERFRHLDYNHLEKLLEKNKNEYQDIFIVTESIFSMDGDISNLKKIIELKKRYNAILYLDEAHSVGCFGKNGLGLAESLDVINDVDILVCPMGKAWASYGAFVICSETIREYLVNFSSTLIFSTALPPVSVQWSRFILKKMPTLQHKRDNLAKLSKILNDCLYDDKNEMQISHIVPFIIGENQKTIQITEFLKQNGFLCSMVRYPSVAKGTARLRISLNSDLSEHNILEIANILKNIKI